MKIIKPSDLRKDDNDQSWFWSAKWQEGEREADDDISNNNIKSFNSAEEAISFLKSEKG